VARLAELARTHTDLSGSELGHLQRLVASWGLLADLCFADLLLFAPVVDDPARFVVVGQIRPTTSQTVYRYDYVGTVVSEAERPLVARAFRLGEIVDGEINLPSLQDRVRVLGIPVRWEGQVIAVLTRESAPSIGRHPGELERVYVEIFWRLASMIEHGLFPFAAEDTESEEAPRVGDGVVLLDAEANVEYASPNAVSALHRVGIHANAEGRRLSELGLQETAVRTAYGIQAPVTEEIERGPDVTVLLRCLPLMETGAVTGGLLLLRDISDLRRRDRMLISMDATIREIHHRVKNNLQTISSLLRLQGRRLESTEAKQAVEESVRRIRSIALVHETLSREAGDDVAFSEIARPLVRMVEESLLSPDHPVRFHLTGDAGKLPARVATPLAVVLTELLQNAVDHAYPRPEGEQPRSEPGSATGGEVGVAGHVEVTMRNDGEVLEVRVEDDGCGLPEGFELESATGLGLSIVRTLVTSELGGTIEMHSDGAGKGTTVELRVPAAVAHHTER
jgi:two-component system, sensor histidine kinase PdtaS